MDGRASGFVDGRASGFVDGQAQGLANALLTALLVRGLDVPQDARARITACSDVETLQRWLPLAMTAANVNEFVQGMR